MDRKFDAEYLPLHSPSEHEDEDADFEVEFQHNVEYVPDKNKGIPTSQGHVHFSFK